VKPHAALRALAFVLSTLCLSPGPTRAQAQPLPAPAAPGDSAQNRPATPPPTGPAQIINRAGRARDARELQQATTRGQSPSPSPAAPPAHAAPGAAPGAAPLAAGPGGAAAAGPQNPHGDAAARERPPIASERADAALAAGTIAVQVWAPDGKPARDTEITLGIMSSDSTRSTQTARTGQDGSALFKDLATGERQAYRVNAPYRGAKYSSNPFRLPQDGGYRVEIRQLPVTRDERMVVLYIGATSLELKDERLHVVQQSRLVNLGSATYVFPEGGALVRLPEGFTAVQTQDVMTDQKVVEEKNTGLRVHGSLPPGEVTLLWGFDLPLDGTELKLAVDIPWLTFAYRVIADAPEGMTLEVEGMPEPMVHADGGRRFLVAEMQRRVGDPPFKRLELALHGIPGPGPGRWIAVLLALLAVGGGIALSRRAAPQPRARSDEGALAARRAELLARARELAALRDAGETGPQYHAEQMALLTDELAALLFEEAEQTRAGSGTASAA
jgi:hypothetical protein